MLSGKKTRTMWCGMRKTIMLTIALVLLAVMVPSMSALADGEPGPPPIELTLEQLSNLVQRLEADLAASRNPVAERLEERLEGIIEGIEGLLDLLERPRDEESMPVVRLRILQFDLTMHRLLYLLEEVLEGTESPQRPGAREALEGLRRWIDGYVNAMTAGMPPEQARRFEATAEQAMRDLVQQLVQMARRARPEESPDTDRPMLARLVERLEELVFRLDGFILRNLPEPAPQPEPRPQHP